MDKEEKKKKAILPKQILQTHLLCKYIMGEDILDSGEVISSRQNLHPKSCTD